MTSLEKIKKQVEADPAATGDDFHERLLDRLEKAIKEAKIDPAELKKLSEEFSEKRRIADTSFSDTFEPQFNIMEEHVCLSDEYPIPTHRTGLIGAGARLVKWVALKIKLRTDVQVSQQAKFNLATLVLLRMASAHLDFVKDVMEDLVERSEKDKAARDTEIRELKEEIARLRERLDGR